MHTMATLGLTKYETLAYTSLLRAAPQNPHQLSKQAGVPTAKIYEVVGRLRQRGIVSEVEGHGYIPRDPDSLMQDVSAKFTRDLSAVRETLVAEHSAHTFHATRNIRGRTRVVEEGALLLSQTEDRIAIAASADLISAWAADIDTAARAGHSCRIISYGVPPVEPEHVDVRAVDRRVYLSRLGRSSVLAVDGRRALFVRFVAGDDWQGTWTDNPAVSAVAVEFVEDRLFLESAIENRWIPWGATE